MEMTQADIAQYALNYMQESQQDHSLEISEFIPLYDLEDNETGYYLTFSKDGAAAGYILLSLLTTGSPVVEFSFDGSGPLDTHTNVSQGATASAAAPSGKFIFVMDGWNTYGRFVKFDYYHNIVGYKIWVRS